MDLYEVFRQVAIEDYALTRHYLGRLSVSGRIGAADPLITQRVKPFTQAVPAGSFPVDVLVVRRENDARVAFARVTFRDVPPLRFEVAFCEGHAAQNERGNFGYSVDAGTGCFADPETELDGDEILDWLRRTSVHTWGWARLPGVIAFSSGAGDGVYVSWFGVDADGEPVCLVTDFNLVALDTPAEAWTGGGAIVDDVETPEPGEAGARRAADLVESFMISGFSSGSKLAPRPKGETAEAIARDVDRRDDDALAAALEQMQGPIHPSLVDVLQRRWSPNPRLRAAILRVLAGAVRVRLAKSFVDLVAALPPTRHAMQVLVAQGRRSEVVRHILSESLELRVSAGLALGSTPILREAAENEALDPELRLECIARIEDLALRCSLYTALAMTGHVAAVQPLAALAIGSRSLSPSASGLASALQSLANDAPSADVREAARKALG